MQHGVLRSPLHCLWRKERQPPPPFVRVVILPAQRESATKLALDDPTLFEQLYSAAQPQLDLTPRGFREPGGGEAAEGGDPVTAFLSRVDKVQAATGLEWTEAAAQVGADDPDLYEAYRATRRKGGR